MGREHGVTGGGGGGVATVRTFHFMVPKIGVLEHSEVEFQFHFHLPFT